MRTSLCYRWKKNWLLKRKIKLHRFSYNTGRNPVMLINLINLEKKIYIAKIELTDAVKAQLKNRLK